MNVALSKMFNCDHLHVYVVFGHYEIFIYALSPPLRSVQNKVKLFFTYTCMAVYMS